MTSAGRAEHALTQSQSTSPHFQGETRTTPSSVAGRAGRCAQDIERHAHTMSDNGADDLV
jgi:hypothetical protein